jgi:hypothetical protein
MTSLYGTFQYFDDSYLNEKMRAYFQDKTGKILPPSMAPQRNPQVIAQTGVVRYLQEYHRNWWTLLGIANLQHAFVTDPTPRTLFLVPEDFLAGMLQCDVSVWMARKVVRDFWFTEKLQPCFLFDQSPSFDIYSIDYIMVSCRRSREGLLAVDDDWYIDYGMGHDPTSTYYEDGTHIIYSMKKRRGPLPYSPNPILRVPIPS